MPAFQSPAKFGNGRRLPRTGLSRAGRGRTGLATASAQPGPSAQRGQGLVEFALLMPVLVTVLMGVIEFSLAFNAQLSLNFATKDASLIAAEAGNSVGSDCVILHSVESDLGPPASPSRVTRVDIFWANADGTVNGSNVNTYTRTGSTTCTFGDGSTLTVPYTATATGYPVSSRCNILKGCGGSHTGLDTIGVKVTYVHPLVTPASKFFGSSPTITFATANSNRMEPVL